MRAALFWICCLAAVGVGLIALGVRRHITDPARALLTRHVDGEVLAEETIEVELLPDTDWAEWLDLSERAGEFAAIYIRVRQGIEARRGPGRHRVPEAAPSWVLNTQEIDAKWQRIVSHETAAAA